MACERLSLARRDSGLTVRPGLVHAHGDDQAGRGGESGDHPDRREDPERVRDHAGQQRADGEPAVAPPPAAVTAGR